MGSKKLEIEIFGDLFEIHSLQITEKEFKKYLTDGVPDEEDDEEEYFEFEEKMDYADNESGILMSDSESPSISIYVNGNELENFENSYKSDITTTIYPVTRLEKNKFYIVKVQTGASANWKLKSKGEFDIGQIKFGISRYELSAGSILYELSPTYNDEDFEYEDGGGFNSSEMYLVDKLGKTHLIP